MDTVTKRYKLDDLGDFMRANHDNGGHYFDADTMRFFGSRLPDGVLYGGRYFITSEKQPNHGSGNHPRMYSVREALVTGEVGHGGSEFQAFTTLGRARTYARALAKTNADAPRCANCDNQLHFTVETAKWGQPDAQNANRYGFGPLCRYCA